MSFERKQNMFESRAYPKKNFSGALYYFSKKKVTMFPSAGGGGPGGGGGRERG